MIASRSLFFRADRAWKFTNSHVLPIPVRFSQVFRSYHVLNCKWRFFGTKDKQGDMGGKKKQNVTAVWRPVCTGTTSAEAKDVQVEYKDSAKSGSDEKTEYGSQIQEVQCTVSGSVSGSRYKHEEGHAGNESANAYVISRSQDSEGRAAESTSVLSNTKYSSSLEVGASLMRFIKGKGGSTQKSVEEEMGIKIVFPSSKNEDTIVIEGTTEESVSRASERIRGIVDEAVKSPTLDYSHFISLPLAIHPELVDKLVNFQKSILGFSDLNEDANLVNDSSEDSGDENKNKDSEGGVNVKVQLKVDDDNEHVEVNATNIRRVSYPSKAPSSSELKGVKHSSVSDLGIERSIFIKPTTFHLTVLMLKLWNKERVATAAEVLKSVSSKVLNDLESRPVSVRLKGLDCMRGSLAKARVIYVPVEEIGGEGRLLRACQTIINAFVEAGLVLEKDAQQSLKLHATVMNARHRKRGKNTRKLDSFDARGILQKHGSEEWGEYLIREAHLSQRFVYDDNGYYRCCASIPFPNKVD